LKLSSNYAPSLRWVKMTWSAIQKKQARSRDRQGVSRGRSTSLGIHSSIVSLVEEVSHPYSGSKHRQGAVAVVI